MLSTSLSLAGSQNFILYCPSLWLPPSPVWFPPCCGGPVFNLLLFFEVFPTFSYVPLLAFLPSIFPPLPILSSHSSPLFSALPLPLILHLLLFFPFLCSYHLSGCLLMPFFLLLLSSPRLPSSSPHVAAQLAAMLCTHASPWPPCLHPLLNYSWESSPCVWRALSRRKEKSAERVMEKQVPPPLNSWKWPDTVFCENEVCRSIASNAYSIVSECI